MDRMNVAAGRETQNPHASGERSDAASFQLAGGLIKAGFCFFLFAFSYFSF
jgi:hypothetical protein